METLGFLIYNILSFESSGSFTFSLPIWVTSASFSCLIAVATTSKTVLNINIRASTSNHDASHTGGPHILPLSWHLSILLSLCITITTTARSISTEQNQELANGSSASITNAKTAKRRCHGSTCKRSSNMIGTMF